MANKYQVGQIYKSKSCGKYELVERVKSKIATPRWKVRFLDTGYETEAYTNNIRTGGILDKTLLNPLGRYQIGQVLETKDNDKVEILDIQRLKKDNSNKTRTYLTVKFLNTGYTTKTLPENIHNGHLKDFLKPSVMNVGMLGYLPEFEGRLKDQQEYKLWESILNRCYQESYEFKNKSYEKAEICERWKRFDYFYKDLPLVEGYKDWKEYKLHNKNKKNIYEFDKDTKVLGNKIYSLETCRFLHKEINAGFTSWAKPETKIKLLDRIEVCY